MIINRGWIKFYTDAAANIQGSKLAGARVHGAAKNVAVHPGFKSWVHAVHPVISAQ